MIKLNILCDLQIRVVRNVYLYNTYECVWSTAGEWERDDGDES